MIEPKASGQVENRTGRPFDGEAFRRMRLSARMSQQALADYLDVSVQHICRIERGKAKIPRPLEFSLRYLASLRLLAASSAVIREAHRNALISNNGYADLLCCSIETEMLVYQEQLTQARQAR